MNTVPLLGDGRGVGGGTARAGRLVVAVAVTVGHPIAPKNNISRQKYILSCPFQAPVL